MTYIEENKRVNHSSYGIFFIGQQDLSGPSEIAYKVTETKVIQELTDAKNQKQNLN